MDQDGLIPLQPSTHPMSSPGVGEVVVDVEEGKIHPLRQRSGAPVLNIEQMPVVRVEPNHEPTPRRLAEGGPGDSDPGVGRRTPTLNAFRDHNPLSVLHIHQEDVFGSSSPGSLLPVPHVGGGQSPSGVLRSPLELNRGSPSWTKRSWVRWYTPTKVRFCIRFQTSFWLGLMRGSSVCQTSTVRSSRMASKSKGSKLPPSSLCLVCRDRDGLSFLLVPGASPDKKPVPVPAPAQGVGDGKGPTLREIPRLKDPSNL